MDSREDPLCLFGFERTADGQRIHTLRSFTHTQAEVYSEACRGLRKVETTVRLLRMVAASADDLLSVFARAAPLTQSADPHWDLADFLYLEVNRKLFHFLATFRMYLDHTDRRLKHLDDGGRARAAWKDLCRYAYDNSFAYRFLYRLRNFAQHRALPLHSMTHSGEATPQGDVHRWRVALETERLLKQYGSEWKEPVRSELASAPEELDVEPLVRELMREIFRNAKLLRGREFPRMRKWCEHVIEVMKEATERQMMPKVGWRTDSGMSFDEMPITLLRHIGYIGPDVG